MDKAQSDPGQACQDQVNQSGLGSSTQGAGCDNQYTPIAKDGTKLSWAQWAGAVYPGATKPSGYEDTVQNQKAPIPPTVDFYTVSFANASRGFAGGAQCREDAPPQNNGESNKDYQERITPFLNTCERVPVIYRYTDNSELGSIWQPSYKGDTPGFVGAISWLHNLDTKEHGQRALAVGGSGSPNKDCPQVAANPPYEGNPPYPTEANPTCGGYPRREPAIPDDPNNPNDANCTEEGITKAKVADVNPDGHKPGVTVGSGQAFWPLSTVTPSQPSASVDQSQTVLTPRDALQAMALCEDNWRQAHDPAGKGRAWLYSDGDWQDLGTAGDGLPKDMRGMTALDAAQLDVTACGSPSNECALAGGLQQIWMWQDGAFDLKPWKPDPTPDSPSKKNVLAYPGQIENAGNPAQLRPCTTSWSCGWHYRVRVIWFGGVDTATALTSGCCSDSSGRALLSYSKADGTWRGGSPGYLGAGVNSPADHRLVQADSYYAMPNPVNGSHLSFLLSPGGPERPGEPPSKIAAPGSQDAEVDRTLGSSARLVAGDGNFLGPKAMLGGYVTAAPGGDNFIDWGVGGFKGTRRALAYTTTTQTTAGNLTFGLN
ncbi:MAG: hypothetical protein QOG26_1577, partial [Solirubrobacterales bacterium]|nr:hypothetical protein [Solirubrobacterales bacterium]